MIKYCYSDSCIFFFFWIIINVFYLFIFILICPVSNITCDFILILIVKSLLLIGFYFHNSNQFRLKCINVIQSSIVSELCLLAFMMNKFSKISRNPEHNSLDIKCYKMLWNAIQKKKINLFFHIEKNLFLKPIRDQNTYWTYLR